MSKVIGIHEYVLKPDASEDRFENAILNAKECGLLRLPGLEDCYLIKGIKGFRSGLYAAVWVYESKKAWENLWDQWTSRSSRRTIPKAGKSGNTTCCSHFSIRTRTRSNLHPTLNCDKQASSAPAKADQVDAPCRAHKQKGWLCTATLVKGNKRVSIQATRLLMENLNHILDLSSVICSSCDLIRQLPFLRVCSTGPQVPAAPSLVISFLFSPPHRDAPSRHRGTP